MMRVVNTKQLVGSVFMELLDQGKNSISLKQIFKIENIIDKKLRRRVSAMTTMCIDDVYQLTQSYEKILSLEEEKVYIHCDGYKLINIKTIIDDYFISGIPKDVAKVISVSIKEWAKDEK